MRQRKRSAGDHNHEGPGAENPEPGDTKPVSEAAPMINWDRSASLFGMPLGRPGPPGFSSQIPFPSAPGGQLEGVPGAIGTSPERMVRNSRL
jgi:hypothetical protein